MKGVILAGGTGSRLYPLTKVTNKHLLPVGRYPMIYHPLIKMVRAGIEDVLIVTGVEHMGDVVRLLGSGQNFSARLTYKVQDQPGGIAQALSLARDFVNGERVLVILGDNLFEDELTSYVRKFREQSEGARILVKKVENPGRFGVAEISQDQVYSIEEKPRNPKSDYCVTGIYFFDPQVFTFIESLQPSKRGEYEITDVNNLYIRHSVLAYDRLRGWWTDAGTPDSLLRSNQYAQDIYYHELEEGLD
ncbi:sugar phosphate nucleotidyltransferase [Mechercharimyces sp. CAU 1602]|uniref:sugar phosphate nucleotidyltransferase n=1 Tax=Mechercharimyces sp. CAU 1602 TaxID=2973933 RepID=UPI002161E753|nr:sugar phosphate nucleotidyltransferase [Mechercharimyces sp. CAU 1602]MCS1351124.1 sugar phosphate nucleotidyltransferase [Mechercharimyces sp. CAU 1602]